LEGSVAGPNFGYGLCYRDRFLLGFLFVTELGCDLIREAFAE
jgi:hypothetical protein